MYICAGDNVTTCPRRHSRSSSVKCLSSGKPPNGHNASKQTEPRAGLRTPSNHACLKCESSDGKRGPSVKGVRGETANWGGWLGVYRLDSSSVSSLGRHCPFWSVKEEYPRSAASFATKTNSVSSHSPDSRHYTNSNNQASNLVNLGPPKSLEPPKRYNLHHTCVQLPFNRRQTTVGIRFRLKKKHCCSDALALAAAHSDATSCKECCCQLELVVERTLCGQ